MSHQCRSGKHCVGRTETGPAATIKPNSVCRGCSDDLARRLKELPVLAKALQSFIGRTPQTALSSKVSRSMSPQPPLNLQALDLAGECDILLSRIGNVLIQDLLRRSATRYDCFIGGKFTQQMLDGVDLALAVRVLHKKAESMVGLAPVYERRRAPCPRCQLPTLGTIVGSGLISCSSSECQWSGPTSEYEAHCLFRSGADRG